MIFQFASTCIDILLFLNNSRNDIYIYIMCTYLFMQSFLINLLYIKKRIESKHEVTILGGLNEFSVKFYGPRGSEYYSKHIEICINTIVWTIIWNNFIIIMVLHSNLFFIIFNLCSDLMTEIFINYFMHVLMTNQWNSMAITVNNITTIMISNTFLYISFYVLWIIYDI